MNELKSYCSRLGPRLAPHYSTPTPANGGGWNIRVEVKNFSATAGPTRPEADQEDILKVPRQISPFWSDFKQGHRRGKY